MAIKSDHWIKEMAKEENMISPFEPNQIKELSGNKVISYGTSSYGYDVRCSSRFKVFTNINSAVVDPKNFDKNRFFVSTFTTNMYTHILDNPKDRYFNLLKHF